MPRASTSASSYAGLAPHYDEFFGPVRVPLEAARRQVLARILPGVTTACDLACGTGATALAFGRQGIRTYALDASPAMCRVARKKALASRLAVRVRRADMRSFRLPERVDLVTCEGDALNHVAQSSDLARVARAVARALRPGGSFFFDVNNSAGFERYWSGVVWLERPDAVLVMRNGHDRAAQHAWSAVELFVRHGRLWRRHSDRVSEVCWSSREIERALRASGFDQVRSWDAAPFFGRNSVVAAGCRTVYLARKARRRVRTTG